MISKSTEEYLKTIYVLGKQNSEIRVTDIAKRMNCSKPSVTKQLNILNDNGYIIYEAYGKIKLTSKGEDLAKMVLEEYDILYLFFSDVLGLSKEESEKEAKAIKGVIDNKTLYKINEYVYRTLGLDELSCDFNMFNEKCRSCLINNNIEEMKSNEIVRD